MAGVVMNMNFSGLDLRKAVLLVLTQIGPFEIGSAHVTATGSSMVRMVYSLDC